MSFKFNFNASNKKEIEKEATPTKSKFSFNPNDTSVDLNPRNEQEERPKFTFGKSTEQRDTREPSNDPKSQSEQEERPKFKFDSESSNEAAPKQRDTSKISFGSNKSTEQSDATKLLFGLKSTSQSNNEQKDTSNKDKPIGSSSKKFITGLTKKPVKIFSDDMIPEKISKNEFIVFNQSTLPIIEEAAKQQNKIDLLKQIETFKKYLQDVKARINKSFEFAELIATEMIIFDLNEANLNDYVAATKALLATNPCSYKPPLLMAKQLVRALINAFFTRINDHDLILRYIKQLESEDIECYLHCQIKRQIKIITEDEMKQKSFTNKSIEIPSFLNNIINKLDKTKTGTTDKSVVEQEKTKIELAIINDDVDSLQKALEEQKIVDYLKFKIKLDPNEKRSIPKKKHPKQSYNQEKSNNPTLLEYAAFHGSEKCFNYLFNEKNCKITKNITKHALCGGNENICEIISNADKSYLEDLEYAIKFHHPNLFKKYFMKYYSHYNGDEKFSYEKIYKKYAVSCIKFFSFRCLRFLIEFGADVKDCMINEALKRDIHSLFIFLMELGVDFNKQEEKSDFAAIHCAIRAGNLTAIQILLANPQSHPLDLNLGDHCGRTPIHFAAIVGNIDIFNLLAKQPNVDLTRLDDEEMTPLHYAARQGKFDIVKRLLYVDQINPNCRNSAYMTPLHYACINGRLDIAKLLLENPLTEVNLHDIGGWAPIHYAVDNLNILLVSALIQHEKINPNVIDSVFFYIIFFFIQFYF